MSSQLKPKHGDVLYIVKYARDGYEVKEDLVDKVGRKYVTLQHGWTRLQFEGEYIRGQDEYGRLEVAFTSKIAAEAYVEKKKLETELYTKLRYLTDLERLSLDQLHIIAGILDTK